MLHFPLRFPVHCEMLPKKAFPSCMLSPFASWAFPAVALYVQLQKMKAGFYRRVIRTCKSCLSMSGQHALVASRDRLRFRSSAKVAKYCRDKFDTCDYSEDRGFASSIDS